MLNQLKGYDFVPKILGGFYAWEHYYLIVEKVKGMTLRQYVNEHSPFIYSSVPQKRISQYLDSIIEIFINLLNAVKAIHDEGIVLSDLSLENIMVTENLGV